jgi:hypothetical protein
MAWMDLSAAVSGTPPSARCCNGFTVEGSKLYVHGGRNGGGMRTGILSPGSPLTRSTTDVLVSLQYSDRYKYRDWKKAFKIEADEEGVSRTYENLQTLDSSS